MYSSRKAIPASLVPRHTIRARNERSLHPIVRSNWSGTSTALVKATFAPAGERFLTWQFMVDARLLNAMTPPRYVRARTDFRLSTMRQLHSHFVDKNNDWRGANNRLQRVIWH